MLEQFDDGRGYQLLSSRAILDGQTSPIDQPTAMRVTTRIYPNGDRGLVFEAYDPANESRTETYTLRIRIRDEQISVWQFSLPGIADSMKIPDDVVVNMSDFDRLLIEPISGFSFSYLNGQVDQWIAAYRGSADEACLIMSLLKENGGASHAWCWSHDLARKRFVISTLTNYRVFGSDAIFGW